MQGIRGGDARALQLLMDRHWHPLVRFATRTLGGVDDAEDVVQEVFVRVWRGRSSGAADESVRAYIYTIARNLMLDRARRDQVKARSADVIRGMHGGFANPMEEAIRGDLQSDFERALSNLPGRRQEAFVLVRLHGLTLREAGDVMGLTPRTVANHVYLAVTDLADALSIHLA